MSVTAKETYQKILLIDLENCPRQIEALQTHLAEFSQVIICYAHHSGAQVPIDWLMPLGAAINKDQLMLFKMASGGKNAADFGICFWAGMLMERLQKTAHFTIVSNDSGLDHLVNLLQSQDCSAERIGSQKTTEVTMTNESLVQTYCEHLIQYPNSRPTKQTTLLASIKNKFKSYPDSDKLANQILQALINQGIVTVDSTNKHITYHFDKVQRLATNGDEDVIYF